MSDKRYFELTPEGCKAAKEYLESIDKLGEFMRIGFSTDGYSLVETANHYKKLEQENTHGHI